MASQDPNPGATPKVIEVACPTCGGKAIYAPSNPWRPFCSERCRQIDLGAWASERYRVADSTPAEGDVDDGDAHVGGAKP